MDCCVLQKYKEEGHDTIILAGAEYGSGSSRDWAAKGPFLQVKLATSSAYCVSPALEWTVFFCLQVTCSPSEIADSILRCGYSRSRRNISC